MGQRSPSASIGVPKIAFASATLTTILMGTGAIDAVLKLREDIGIDRSITDLGASDETLDLLVADALADPVNFSNPRPVDEDSVRALYQAAW